MEKKVYYKGLFLLNNEINYTRCVCGKDKKDCEWILKITYATLKCDDIKYIEITKLEYDEFCEKRKKAIEIWRDRIQKKRNVK